MIEFARQGHGCRHRGLSQELPVMDACRFEQLRQGHGGGHRGLGQELHVIDDDISGWVRMGTYAGIEAFAQNCPSLNVANLGIQNGKATDVGIEALAKNCPSLRM